MSIVLLYEDEDLVIVDKPAGYHVHPPEDGYPVPRELICLYHVRKAVGQHVHPVHRIDVSTTGLLLFAKNKEAASHLGKQFSQHSVRKNYWAVVRGYVADQGKIDLPLESDSTQQPVPAETHYRLFTHLELPHQIGTRFATARYSWIEASPVTGRFHQLRRHFNRISHPLIGDGTHGDSRHNRFFRESLGIPGLCLRAHRLELIHPRTGQKLIFQAPMIEKWRKIQELFKGFDPLAERQ